jgi:anthranilate phosphoribosyltransferase
VQQAAELIDSGAAARTLDAFIRVSQSFKSEG